MAYNFKEVEAKWKSRWEIEKLYETDIHSEKKKLYLLVEFPYPSGAGLHMGHMRSYTAMDVIARKGRALSQEVLFPIGWDAFGLPAENYAIKTGIHPSISTRENINNFRRQLKECGFSFDWTREVDTTDPAFYKWSQWIFLKMYEKDLAYKKKMPVNWCPKDKCVLANEEVIDGKCERCGTDATKKDKEQWMLAITKYAKRLDKDLDDTDYLDKIKIQQRNWIGISEGSEIRFDIKSKSFCSSFSIFTTRADTLFGCTYCVLAPEHSLVQELLEQDSLENKEEVKKYCDDAKQKLDIDRSAEGREKTGVKLEGVIAVNPVNGEEVPIFIADYVLPQYGTGAIMAVPAHDARDYEFAVTYHLPIKEVIASVYGEKNNDATERNRVGIIIEKDDKFLCEEVIISETKFNSKYILLGGGIENDEDELTAVRREIKEEIGIEEISHIQKIGTYRLNWFSKKRNENRTQLHSVYKVDIDTSEIIENEKEAKLVWLTKEELFTSLKDECPDQYDAVQKYISGKNNIYSVDDGELINSSEFTGMTSEEARYSITEKVSGKFVIKSKLRDWVFARQRYWGEPIPIVYDKNGVMYPVADSELPIKLPQVDNYEPTDNGESPLYQVPEWVNVLGKIDDSGHFVSDEKGEEFRRETDTMPQWAGSSWYFMRYIDPDNKDAIADKDLLAKWLPVNWYNGGMEHTTLHLLYSRFWYKFLFDIGLVSTSEPYLKRTSQGMILGADGGKMSKSVGNIVNPDEIIKEYGADVLRTYEMFIAPFDQAVAWDDKAIVGVKRFLDRVDAFAKKVTIEEKEYTVLTHKTIKNITEGIDAMAFNTCISTLMIWLNEYEKIGIDKENFKVFLKLLSPFAPYISDELYELLGEKESVHKASWPAYDSNKLIEDVVTIAVQINGKVRGTITIKTNSSENEVMTIVKNKEYYTKYSEGKETKKIVFVSNKIINIIF